jgi:hypothetical protein
MVDQKSTPETSRLSPSYELQLNKTYSHNEEETKVGVAYAEKKRLTSSFSASIPDFAKTPATTST